MRKILLCLAAVLWAAQASATCPSGYTSVSSTNVTVTNAGACPAGTYEITNSNVYPYEAVATCDTYGCYAGNGTCNASTGQTVRVCMKSAYKLGQTYTGSSSCSNSYGSCTVSYTCN